GRVRLPHRILDVVLAEPGPSPEEMHLRSKLRKQIEHDLPLHLRHRQREICPGKQLAADELRGMRALFDSKLLQLAPDRLRDGVEALGRDAAGFNFECQSSVASQLLEQALGEEAAADVARADEEYLLSRAHQ